MDLIAGPIPGYELLDSGEARKLERIAGALVIRPSPAALWRPRLDARAWSEAPSECIRNADGSGQWQHRRGDPGELRFAWQGPGGGARALTLLVRFTAFGHCGLFFEQEPVWRMLAERIAALRAAGKPAKGLNLFGYTGAASLAMAAAGGEVYHVDSARGVLTWGKESAAASGVDGVKWVQEDARAFLALSRRKGFRYDCILADPPSWGHGADKQVWKIEEHLQGLVDDCVAVLADGGLLVLCAHSPGVQHAALANALGAAGLPAREGGDLGVRHRDDPRVLPAGCWAAADRR
ncbi:MAG TPA: class I SAM-dependent methyltransferase [Planctomycetota bacterium]|nr:class I SAM-dependent methyltransferase [Planctomycetota bacterium]